MAEATALLAVLRLTDSALPVGGYTLSHGLEAFAAANAIATPDVLEPLLVTYVLDAIGPTDAVACAATWTYAAAGDLERVAAVDHHLYSLKIAREPRDGATRAGRRLLALGPAWGDAAALRDYRAKVREGMAPGCYAAAFGLAGQTLGAARANTVVGYLHAALLGLLAAAQRLTSLDHEQAQAILGRLGDTISLAASTALATDWRAMASAAPEIDIMTMRHERAFVRLFAS